MKVLQVTPRYPPHTGGVETHVEKISEQLVERGHEVIVHSADLGPDVERREVRNGVEVHRHRAFSLDDSFHIAPGISSSIYRSNADIVHAHNYHSLPLFFAALAITDERFIITTHYHGKSASRFRDQLLSLYRPFGKWGINQADQVIAVSEWERSRLRVDFDASATVIPNGVEVERFASADPENRERPYLLTVGRLEKYKGVQQVIRAMPELEEFALLVVGLGPYRKKLERIASEVGGQVEFLGYVDDDRLPRLYAGAEVYVTLSEFEAYGMTVAEALAAGTPCVVRESRALADWARFDGCSGITRTKPDIVANAVRSASGTTPDQSGVPHWSDVTDRLEAMYKPRFTVSSLPK